MDLSTFRRHVHKHVERAEAEKGGVGGRARIDDDTKDAALRMVARNWSTNALNPSRETEATVFNAQPRVEAEEAADWAWHRLNTNAGGNARHEAYQREEQAQKLHEGWLDYMRRTREDANDAAAFASMNKAVRSEIPKSYIDAQRPPSKVQKGSGKPIKRSYK